MRSTKLLNYKNLKPFKIIRAIKNITYKLDLFKLIKKLFLVFYF